MKNYLEFERDIKILEEELEKLKDPFNKEGISEVETDKIAQIQNQIDDKLKNRVQLGLAMQSMNTDVLSNIKRKNLATQKQIDMIHAIQKRGKTATTELIIPLPGETEKTYFLLLAYHCATMWVCPMCAALNIIARVVEITRPNITSKGTHSTTLVHREFNLIIVRRHV